MTIQSATDHGYVPARPACVSCGRTDTDYCCDPQGEPLPEAVAFLMSLQGRMMRERRFGTVQAYGDPWAQLMVRIEGDIEEWLIEHDYLAEGWSGET